METIYIPRTWKSQKEKQKTDRKGGAIGQKKNQWSFQLMDIGSSVKNVSIKVQIINSIFFCNCLKWNRYPQLWRAGFKRTVLAVQMICTGLGSGVKLFLLGYIKSDQAFKPC